MSEERLVNFIIYVIMDSCMEAWENGLEQERQNFLAMRSNPECLTYVANWVKTYKKFLRRTDRTLHNPELEMLTHDGLRLCYAHYFNDDKLYDGTKTSDYARERSAFYKEDTKEREEQ